MKIYRRLKQYSGAKIGYAYASITLAVLATIAMILPYYWLYQCLDDLILRADFRAAGAKAIGITISLILYGAFYMASAMCSHALGFRFETDLKKTGLKKIMTAPFSFFDRHSSGQIRKILDDNASLTHASIAHLIPDQTVAALMPILILATNFLVDWRIGLLTLVIIVLAFILVRFMTGEQSFMDLYMKLQEEMNARAVEYVRGMPVVKIFKADVHSIKAFYQSIAAYSKAAYQYSMSCRGVYVPFQLLLGGAFLLLIPLGFWLFNEGEVPAFFLSKAIFFVVFFGLINFFLMGIMYVGMHHFLANNAVDKIEALVREIDEAQPERGRVERLAGTDICFDKVTFSYGDHPVIEDLSFHLEGGKTYALVGPSGGGKSTIAKLISGFYSLSAGQILIGGLPLSAYSEACLTKNIAFVFQQSGLFKVSLYENVRMGRPDAGREEVLAAMTAAQCDPILAKFPERENTLIGSHGVHLSGGEIQRIAIARAILKDAPIVVLDEASAAADPDNEFEIQQALTRLMQGKTVVMIAHRLSSIQGADEVLVVEAGQIVERGRHDGLMAGDGRYATLQRLFSQANDWQLAQGGR